MLLLRHIEILRALHAAGSITGAAQILHVSQPAVSRAVAYIEARLGFPLFLRVHGRLAPTREGKALLEAAVKVQDHFERVQTLAMELRSGSAAPLRIVMNPSLGHAIGQQALARFMAVLPSVRLQVDIEPTSVISELITQERADIGIVLLPLANPSVESMELGEAQLVCVLPRDHPLGEKSEIGPADLAGVPLVSYPGTTMQGMLLDEAFSACGVERVIHTTVRYAYMACNFVANGIGAALVDSFSISPDLAPRLVVRTFTPTMRFKAFGLWSRAMPKPRHADLVFRLIREEIERVPDRTVLL